MTFDNLWKAGADWCRLAAVLVFAMIFVLLTSCSAHQGQVAKCTLGASAKQCLPGFALCVKNNLDQCRAREPAGDAR